MRQAVLPEEVRPENRPSLLLRGTRPRRDVRGLSGRRSRADDPPLPALLGADGALPVLRTAPCPRAWEEQLLQVLEEGDDWMGEGQRENDEGEELLHHQ